MKPRKCKAPCNNKKLVLHEEDKAHEERSWVCKKCGAIYLDAYGPKSPSFKRGRKP